MKHLAPTDVADWLAKTPGALLLDVREPWEFELAAIRVPGTTTLNLPMGEVVQRVAELDPAQPTLCICHHGARSAQVVAFLERGGFASVYNLDGGTDAWSQLVDRSLPRY
jgi:rhodanese-related sulfurtransferase